MEARTTLRNTDPAPDAGPEAPRGALDRALKLVDLLGSELPHATLSELAEASGLSLSTASRLLGTLAAAGLVQRDAAREYALGPRLVELGRRAAEMHATTSLDRLHPIREDTVAVLRRELRDRREALLRHLRERPDTAFGAGGSAAHELAEAAARETTWHDCAVRIEAHPGVVIEDDQAGADSGERMNQCDDPDQGFVGLAETRARTLAFIESLRPDALSRVGTHHRYGPVSVLQCLEAIARGDHDQLLRLQGKPTTDRQPLAHAPLPSIIHDRRVLLHHVNMSGVVTTPSMLVYLEEAEAALLRRLGLAEFERRFIRIYFEIQHRRPSRYDDVLTVHLMVSRVGARSTHYDFTIFNRGAVAAFGRWGLAFTDESGGPASLPEHVRRVLEKPEEPARESATNGSLELPSE